MKLSFFQDQTQIKSFFIAFGAASIVAALFFGYLGRLLLQSEEALLSMPKTNGKIKTIEIQKIWKHASSSKSSSQNQFWMIVVSYEYVVNGKTYEGKNLSNSPLMESIYIHSTPSAALLSLQQKYAAGKEVEVFYSAADPQKSLLEISSTGAKHFFIAALISLFLAICGFTLPFFYKILFKD